MRRTRPLWILAAATLAACGSDDATVATETPPSDVQAAAEASCDDIQRFADTIGDTGIVFDYQASDSPAQLSAAADAVFGGELTGRISTTEIVSTDDPNPWTFVGFEIQVDRVAKATDGVEVGVPVEVFVEYNPAGRRDAVSDEAPQVAAGVPVVVFAGHRGDLGELSAFVPEGFMTACADGPLLGQAGTQGQWGALDSLEAVLDAVESDAPSATPPTTTSTSIVDATTATDTTAAPPPGPSAIPDRPATVTGTVGTDNAGRPGTLENASDRYYAGMGLSQGNPVVIDTATGERVPLASLRSGERISVWIDNGCAESFPVQCDVTAIAVHRDP